MRTTTNQQPSTTRSKRTAADGPSKRAPTPVTADRVSRMSRGDLDALFRTGIVGQIPEGEAEGTAIFFPGHAAEPTLQRLTQQLLWQGKRLDARGRTLKNRISPFGLHAIAADMYYDASWFDGAECIVLDYSKRSRVARQVRDEIRRVGSGLYLGLVYWGQVRTQRLYFTLQFPV